MRNRLRIAVLAAALTIIGLPASAVDLPNSGSKNFNPPSGTPSYFSNETVPVSARTADTTENDWSAVDALVPDRPAQRPMHPDRRIAGRHGHYTVLHASVRRAGGSSGAARAPVSSKRCGLVTPETHRRLQARPRAPNTSGRARRPSTAGCSRIGAQAGPLLAVSSLDTVAAAAI
jgi:hypothetical protein